MIEIDLRPQAILSISAHWFVQGSFVQSTATPKKINDFYDFPEALYQVPYPAPGSPALSARVQELLEGIVQVNDDWGIDHGTWTVLVHVFPDASIPVVQLSIDGMLSPEAMMEIGRRLRPLREEGVFILGSGDIVHNLAAVDWNASGRMVPEAAEFDQYILDALLAGNTDQLVRYKEHPYARFAVPMHDHLSPIFYIWGAAEGERPVVFNEVGDLGSVSMTSYLFGGPDVSFL